MLVIASLNHHVQISTVHFCPHTALTICLMLVLVASDTEQDNNVVINSASMVAMCLCFNIMHERLS